MLNLRRPASSTPSSPICTLRVHETIRIFARVCLASPSTNVNTLLDTLNTNSFTLSLSLSLARSLPIILAAARSSIPGTKIVLAESRAMHSRVCALARSLAPRYGLRLYVYVRCFVMRPSAAGTERIDRNPLRTDIDITCDHEDHGAPPRATDGCRGRRVGAGRRRGKQVVRRTYVCATYA